MSTEIVGRMKPLIELCNNQGDILDTWYIREECYFNCKDEFTLNAFTGQVYFGNYLKIKSNDFRKFFDQVGYTERYFCE
jgi:hypothetical protein